MKVITGGVSVTVTVTLEVEISVHMQEREGVVNKVAMRKWARGIYKIY